MHRQKGRGTCRNLFLLLYILTRCDNHNEEQHNFPQVGLPLGDMCSRHIIWTWYMCVEWKLASTVNPFGARVKAAQDCSMLSRSSIYNPGRMENPSKPSDLEVSSGNALTPGSACAMWLFGFVLETQFLWPPFLRFASVQIWQLDWQTKRWAHRQSALPLSVGHLLQFH